MSTWEHFKELGNNDYKNKNYQAAIALYTDGININPEADVLYANRSLCHKALHNYRAAMSDLDKALAINGANVKNLKRKAEILVITGNIAEAIALFQRCVYLEKKEYQHKTDLAVATANLDKFNKLIEAFNKEDYIKAEEFAKPLSDVCTGSKDVKRMYIECLINNNKLTEATHFWSTKLNDQERIDDEFLYLICKIFYYEGNYEKAKNFMKKLLSKVNDNQKYNKLYSVLNNIEKEKEVANGFFKNQDYEKAIEAYSKLLELDPKNKIFNSTIIANRALCKS